MANLSLRSILQSLQHSITKKLLVVVFSVYIILTFSVTVIQMYVEYVTAKSNIVGELHRFEEIISKSLVGALWEYGIEEVQSILQGVTNSGVVLGARVTTTLGEQEQWEVGYVSDRISGEINYVDPNTKISKPSGGLFEQLIAYSFPLMHQGPEGRLLEIAEVTLYTSNAVIWQKIKLSYFLFVLNAILKTIALWFFFLWAGYVYLTRPLTALTEATRKISQGDLNTEVNVDKKHFAGTEIDILATSFNSMVAQLDAKNKELLQVQSRLKGIVRAMPSVLISLNKDGIITDWNSEAEVMSSIPKKNAIAKNIYEVFPAFSRYKNLVDQTLSKKMVQNENKVLETRGDEAKYFDIVVYPVINKDYMGAVVRIDDITHRVKLEEMMVQTEKLSSVGALAAGITHEINNPLGIILQGVQNVKRRIDKNLPANAVVAEEMNLDLEKVNGYFEKRKILEFLEGIQKAGERAASIVSNLLQFSRKSTSTKGAADLSDIIEKALELAAADYGLKKQMDFRTIKITKNYEQNLPQVFCSVMEIEQVILNLLKNAAQAMQDIESPEIILQVSSLGDRIQLIVGDNGPGMEEQIRKRIMEPFFTTKPVGEGTGLGLAVSYAIIVKNHQGSIDVESVVGKGTKFIITLPINSNN